MYTLKTDVHAIDDQAIVREFTKPYRDDDYLITNYKDINECLLILPNSFAKILAICVRDKSTRKYNLEVFVRKCDKNIHPDEANKILTSQLNELRERPLM